MTSPYSIISNCISFTESSIVFLELAGYRCASVRINGATIIQIVADKIGKGERRRERARNPSHYQAAIGEDDQTIATTDISIDNKQRNKAPSHRPTEQRLPRC